MVCAVKGVFRRRPSGSSCQTQSVTRAGTLRPDVMDSDDEGTCVEMMKIIKQNIPDEEKRSGALKDLESAWLIGTGSALVAWSDDKRHRRKCKQSPCTRCNFVDRGPELAKMTPNAASGHAEVSKHIGGQTAGCKWVLA